MRYTLLFLLSLALGCVGQAPRDSGSAMTPLGVPLPDDALHALRDGSEFKLLSIDPSFGGAKPDLEEFHGFGVLGQTAVGDSDRTRLVAAMKLGAEESVGAIAACFNPRHGLSLIHDGKRYDFLICFECLQIRWFVEDRRREVILTSESPKAVFDATLTNASVVLADPA
ncbi:MAG: hypothetical protein ACF8CQ_03600 [Rhodopirellula sp. JB044]|uniref:hypothetical protein n=1 Tax=Rhodopirellula sp. JB044 TaxID=3342844 RepID=UPI00370A492F